MKIIYVTGIGQLHILNTAKAVKEANPNIDISIITTFNPSESTLRVLDFFKLKSLKKQFSRRADILKKFDNVETIFLPQLINFILGKFLNKEIVLGWSFFIFGLLLNKKLNNYKDSNTTLIIRSGSGGNINNYKNLFDKVIVDHSIAHHSYFKKLDPYRQKNKEMNENNLLWRLVDQDCKSCHLIIANSSYVKNSFPKGYPEITTIYLPVENRNNRINIADIVDSNYFIFIGHCNFRKGSDRLFKISKILSEIDSSIKIKVVGYAHEKNHNSNLEFLGFKTFEETQSLLRKSKGLIFPTRLEGCARVIHEAMSYGIPAITTEDGGSLVSNLQNGVLISNFDHTEVKMILSLYDDNKTIDKISLNAFSDVNRICSEDYYASKIIETIK